MENPMTFRPALDRIFSMGALYDMRTDNFCGQSIFKKAIPPGALTILDSHFSDIQIITSDTYSEKFLKMDINAELSVSLLAGNIILGGFGQFVYDKTNTSRVAKCAVVYKILTKDEELNINHEDLQAALSTDGIQEESATHMVTGISWGANVVISCTHETKDNKNLKEIQGKLTGQVKLLAASISGKASIDKGKKDGDIKFEIRFFGDGLPEHGESPVTFEGALELIKQLPKMISNCNAGKGKPLVYRFLPISKLRRKLNLEIKIDNILISLQDSALARIVDLFDELAEAKQELNDFEQEVTEHRYWLKKKETNMISRYVKNINNSERDMKSHLFQVLTNVRSAKLPISEIIDFITKIYTSDHVLAPDTIAATIDEWKPIKKRIAFAKRLVQKGAIYIDLNHSLDDLLPFDKPETISFVFYFSHASQTVNQDCWKRNYSLFLSKMENKTAQGNETTTFYAMDCELHDITLPENISSCVKVYKGDECTVEDLLEDNNQNTRADNEMRPQPIYTVLPSALSALLNSPNKNQHHVLFYTSPRRSISEQVLSSDTDYVKLPTGVLDEEAVLKVYNGNDASRETNILILEHPDISQRVKHTLPVIVNYAIQLPNLLGEHIPYLNQGRQRTIYVTRRLACSLLAHCFLSTVPDEGRPADIPTFHFLHLFHMDDPSWTGTQVKLEKLKYILEYFNQMGNISSEEGDKIISFERRCVPERRDWESSKIQLCDFSFDLSSGIETAKDMLQVDFTNKHIGIGLLNEGSFVFENYIRFLTSPELILFRLFTESLLDDEVLIVTGTKQFTTYSELGPTLRFEAGVDTNPVEIDSFGRESCQVVFMDTLQFGHLDNGQFEKRNIDRELHKFFVGFSLQGGNPAPVSVATGNRGASIFNGDTELKILLLWMAASMAGRPSIVFHAGSVEECDGIMELGLILKTRALSVGKLYKVLLNYERNRESSPPHKHDASNPNYERIFQFIRDKLIIN